MKKLLLLFIILSTLAIVGCQTEVEEPTLMQGIQATQVSAPAAEVQEPINELSAHNTIDDCWTIIDGKVYNLDGRFFKYSEAQRMIDACGTDGTDLFYQIYSDNENSQGLSRELVMLEEFEI